MVLGYLNVLEDAFDIVRVLWATGNRDVEIRMLRAANRPFPLDAEDYKPEFT